MKFKEMMKEIERKYAEKIIAEIPRNGRKMTLSEIANNLTDVADKGSLKNYFVNVMCDTRKYNTSYSRNRDMEYYHRHLTINNGVSGAMSKYLRERNLSLKAESTYTTRTFVELNADGTVNMNSTRKVSKKTTRYWVEE